MVCAGRASSVVHCWTACQSFFKYCVVGGSSLTAGYGPLPPVLPPSNCGTGTASTATAKAETVVKVFIVERRSWRDRTRRTKGKLRKRAWDKDRAIGLRFQRAECIKATPAVPPSSYISIGRILAQLVSPRLSRNLTTDPPESGSKSHLSLSIDASTLDNPKPLAMFDRIGHLPGQIQDRAVVIYPSRNRVPVVRPF